MAHAIRTIEDLCPDSLNANLGTERGRAALERSIRELGAGRSILTDRAGTVIAGNKTLEIAAELGIPIRAVETDGDELVVVVRRDLDMSTDPRARRLAYSDNRVGELDLQWDTARLVRDLERGVDLGGLFDRTEVEGMIAKLSPGADAPPDDPVWGDGGERGTLLSYAAVTIADPRHKPLTGDRWALGPHILFVCDIFLDWPQWAPALSDGSVFVPLAGPWVPLARGGPIAGRPLVMVQPDHFIAGHLLDAWENEGNPAPQKLGGHQ